MEVRQVAVDERPPLITLRPRRAQAQAPAHGRVRRRRARVYRAPPDSGFAGPPAGHGLSADRGANPLRVLAQKSACVGNDPLVYSVTFRNLIWSR